MHQILIQFRDFLHQRSLRVTNLREGIVKSIIARNGHFDIYDLVRDLHAQGIDASRATVYRTLPLLQEAGIIQSTVNAGERHHYETTAGREHHDHLICNACGKVTEFQLEAFEILQREVASKYGFTLTGHTHQLFGFCSECRSRFEKSQ